MSFVKHRRSASRGSLLIQSPMPRQVDLNAVLNSLTNGCPIPAEEINQAITLAAHTSIKTCLELIKHADPSMLGEAARRLTIQVFADNEQWAEVLAAFVQLGARKQQADAAVVLHVLNALLSLSRGREALAAYEHLIGQPIIEELSSASGSTASPETSTSSGRVVLQHGKSGRLAVPQPGRAWSLWAVPHSQGRDRSTGRPATASGAGASRLQSRPFPRM